MVSNVPVLENFGFRVLKETPTRLDGTSEGHIHEFLVVTADGSPSAHFEHTVLTTDSGPEILTIPRAS